MWNLESWGNSYNSNEYAASYEFYKKKPMSVSSQPNLTGTGFGAGCAGTTNCSDRILAKKKCNHFTDNNKDNKKTCNKHYQIHGDEDPVACHWNQANRSCDHCQKCTFDNSNEFYKKKPMGYDKVKSCSW